MDVQVSPLPDDTQSESAYGATPQEQWVKWSVEVKAAQKAFEKFQKRGDEIDKEFRGEQPEGGDPRAANLGAFTSSTKTQHAILVGPVPKADVERRWDDASDDIGRVAALLVERNINLDIEMNADSVVGALENAANDYLIPGLGQMCVDYQCQWEDVPAKPAILPGPNGRGGAPAVPAGRRKTYECADLLYVHWKDWLCNPGKTVDDHRWRGRASNLTRAKLVKRFGDVGKLVPLSKRRDLKSNREVDDPWGTARVWEIQDKENGKRVWWCESYPEGLLDEQPDPLGIEGFWNDPTPLRANWSTSSFLPRADYSLHEGLYKEAETLKARIRLLIDGVKLVGLYDSSFAGALAGLFEGGAQNKMYPMQNFGLLAEKGGITGILDFMPLEQTMKAVAMLNEQLNTTLEQINQMTGMSDIMRGQADAPGATATEQRLKSQYGSVRIQERQRRIARFFSELLTIKARVIFGHFETDTILRRANWDFTEDGQMHPEWGPQAVEMLRNRLSDYRIEVKPESISVTDFAAKREENLGILEAVSTSFQQLTPLLQAAPEVQPFILKLIQAMVATLPGAKRLEGVLDAAVDAAEKAAQQQAANPQPAPPDPKVQAAQLKAQADAQNNQADMAREQFKAQAAAQQAILDSQIRAQEEEAQTRANVQEHAQKLMLTRALAPPRPPVKPTPRNGRIG